MVEILNFEDSYYYPPKMDGLKKLVRFPDGEVKRNSISNSTIWVFEPHRHKYKPEIFGNDVGCGMSAFLIKEVDAKESADKICDYLKNKNILGRGNHFVDICEPINSYKKYNDTPYNILLIHSDGKSFDNTVPKNIKEAKSKQANAEKFREELGYKLTDLIDSSGEILCNLTHNTVEDNGEILYRKGVVKTKPKKIHFLPAHLGAKVWFYTVDEKNMPPYSSMPHATGRSGPRGETKVSLEKAASIRDLAYIPDEISNSSLRTEHPSCYNDHSKIIDKLSDYIIPIDDSKILSYVGKV